VTGRFAVVGAGPAGALMAVYLARRGHRVAVYERRADLRTPDAAETGRSINLGLSQRGIRALAMVGLVDAVMPSAVPMRGRVVHRPGGRSTFQPYGSTPDQILYSIRRNDLNAAIVDHAERLPGVEFFFDTAFTRLERDRPGGTVVDRSGVERAVSADAIVGADGVFSAVRREMHRGGRANYAQEFLDWAYKEFTIPAPPVGTTLEALHIWPGREGLVVAHPNNDGSLTGTLFLPHAGPAGFAGLESAPELAGLLARYFPALPELVPDLAEQLRRHAPGNLVTVRTSPWHRAGHAVLIGDAAHAVYPFYGQGMNSALEDCVVLDQCLAERPDDLAAAFGEYQRRRKRHTDVLATLSARNFADLRNRVHSPLYAARARADLVLNRLLPQAWQPLYTMISHTTVPYANALARSRRQDAVLDWLALGAATGATLTAYRAVRRAGRRR
jgi:kynurenine 3-monooxygenase